MPTRVFVCLFSVFASLIISFTIQAASVIQETNGVNQFIVTSATDQPESGLLTLREAIALANTLSSSEIIFDSTVFSTPQTISLQQGEMIIISNVDIIGPGANLLTVDAVNQSRILNINDNTQSAKSIEITGITFSNGNAVGKGGCIKSDERLILKSVVISNCTSSFDGGGVSTVKNGNLIENSLFINNLALKGGGLAHQSGNAGDNLVIGSTFAGNIATNRGGGIFIFQTSGYQILNSTFSENMSVDGAGVRLNSSAVVRNSTFVDNVGVGVSMRHNNIQNSIITGNTGGDCVFVDTGFDNVNNIDSDGSCDFGAINHTTVSDPLLEPLANFGGLTLTHRPLPDSPAIDAADDLFCPDFDQRGETRPQDGDADNDPICDIGAVELAELESVPEEIIYQDGFDFFD